MTKTPCVGVKKIINPLKPTNKNNPIVLNATSQNPRVVLFLVSFLTFHPLVLRYYYFPPSALSTRQPGSAMPGVAITMDIWSSGHGSLHQQAAMNSISTSSIPPGLDPDPLQLSTTSPAMCQPAFPGTLSLHHYRKQLSDGDSFVFESQEGHILKRKNAALHLNQTPMYPHHSAHPFSVSSAASSPPPLSPSYSPSAMSEQGPESLCGFACK